MRRGLAVSTTTTPTTKADKDETVAASEPASGVRQLKEGQEVIDLAGAKWIVKLDKETGEWFYFNEKSWETRNDRPANMQDDAAPAAGPAAEAGAGAVAGGDADGAAGNGEVAPRETPQYATEWSDARFPDWVQYMEFQSKRPYYHNRATSETTWAPPDQPELDVFRGEIAAQAQALTMVPANAPLAALHKRFAAVGVDLALSFGGGVVFGGLVFLDIGSVLGASASVGFMTWGLFMARDMIFERGTRSPGKRLFRLEIVKVDGQLPSRWNTLFRQVYLPVYAGFQLLMPYIFIFSAADLGLLLFTPKRQRLGDFIAQTRVIEELPDREARLAEKMKRDDEDDAKE